MSLSARLQQSPTADRRGSRRGKLLLESSFHASGDDVTVHDFFHTGMVIETASDLSAFDRLELKLPEVGIVHAIIVWSSGRFYACEIIVWRSRAVFSSGVL